MFQIVDVRLTGSAGHAMAGGSRGTGCGKVDMFLHSLAVGGQDVAR